MKSLSIFLKFVLIGAAVYAVFVTLCGCRSGARGPSLQGAARKLGRISGSVRKSACK